MYWIWPKIAVRCDEPPGRRNPMLNADREHCAAAPLLIVIDDDAAVRASLKFALESEGFAVRTYRCGDDLLDDAGLRDCACFIVDQRLPAMSGLEVVAALRRMHVAAPAVLITSHPTIILQERAARAGVPIVEKPLLGNALIDRVRELIARSRAGH
jgi:FixJ family two-component response regulator